MACFEIDQEMDAILLIIGIVYRVCRIVNKSVQQCTYFLFSVNLLLVCVNYEQEPCKFPVNKRQNTNYSFLPVTSKVSCIRKKRGQIICLQGNNKSMVIFVLKRRKVVFLADSYMIWHFHLINSRLSFSTIVARVLKSRKVAKGVTQLLFSTSDTRC